MENAEFEDTRLVAVYDVECPWSRDDDFFLSLLAESPAVRVLDLGCGTGRLALGMAAAGYTVTGVDPAAASLDAARAKPGAGRVSWTCGDSAVLADSSFDAAVMTSHVAQFFVDDDAWQRTLADLHRALVPGGRLVFDTRDPAARAWERWNPVDSRRVLTLPDGRVVEVSTEVTDVRAAVVTFSRQYTFAEARRPGSDGEAAAPRTDEAVSTSTLRFRTEAEVRSSLEVAGFTAETVFGGWDRQPVGAGDGELIVVARA